MPAKDIFHETVKKALLKEGWTITDDPLMIEFGGVNLYVDLGAAKVIAAEKAGQQIAVEIKSFLSKSFISEFHHAVGQFMDYRLVLSKKDPERILYLAIPDDTYKSYFFLEFTQAAIESFQLKFLVYDIEQEVIVKWQR
jgi:hypothetical protein